MNLLLMILGAVVAAFLLAYLVVKFVPLKMRWLVSVLLLLAAGFLVLKINDGIMEPIRFDEDKQVRYSKVIKNLKVIRDAQVKFSEVHGKYTSNKDSLVSFIENGKLPITQTTNVEKRVHTGGGIYKTISVRKVDTVDYEPVNKYFKDKDYKGMFKVPGTDKEYEIKTGLVEKVAGLMVPVFEAKADKKDILKGLPFHLVKQELEAKETDEIKGAFVSVGSLDKVTTGGNWPPSYDQNDAKEDKK